MGGVTTKYLYDGANVVQEQNASGAATANLLTGLEVDQVFSRQVVGGTTSSLLTDALGSTIALSDPAGAVRTTFTYEPFGRVSASGAPDTNPYRFTGREDDGATGLYHYRARYYHPGLSRFVSEDPLGFPGGPDPNLYAYVTNRPTMLTDPFGLEPTGCGFLGFGCVASVFSSFTLHLNVQLFFIDFGLTYPADSGFHAYFGQGVGVGISLTAGTPVPECGGSIDLSSGGLGRYGVVGIGVAGDRSRITPSAGIGVGVGPPPSFADIHLECG